LEQPILANDLGQHDERLREEKRIPMTTTVEQPVESEYDRIPYLVAYQNTSSVRDVYGGVAELVVLESYLLRPKNPEPSAAGAAPAATSDTVLVFMHPVGGGAYLPMISALARAGHHVIYCNSRFRGTDSALLMEKVVEDLGECIKDAKNRLGYDKVVLVGWSGGGSLSVFYQQQAQHPTITASPSGDGPDLTKLGLIPVDGIILLAAHISRHGTMTEWMDASILDESDPTTRDPELDLYNPDNPNQPPYTTEFLDRYRQAQIQRNRRITKWVKEKLAELRTSGRPGADVEEFAFVVHGTMADPRWLDPTVDPNDRAPGTCYLGDPQVVNNSAVGLARFCTLRSWLSQWSYDDANGDALDCGPDIAVPALVIGNLADDACTPSHTHRLFEAIGHPDKEMYEIPGANHYYSGPGQGRTLRQAVGVCTDWLHRHGFSSDGRSKATGESAL
jgi:pimeloyl-ACP methyl ester carboxylesterase